MTGNRLKALREKLKEKNVDAAFVSKRENYIYLSGFTGTSAHLIITQNDAVLLTDFRYVQQAATQAPLFEVIQHQGGLLATLKEVLKSRGIGRLGFEETWLTYDKYIEYDEKLELEAFVPLGGVIEALRMMKDALELDEIKQAVKIGDDAFTHILGFIKPGVSEAELAAEMEYYMKKQGAKGPSFETIVASGERSAMPHGVASERKLRLGDTVTLDYGAIYHEYCSDMTRTVFLGTPGDEMKKIYRIVLEAQLKALEGAHKGLTGKEIDLIARELISKQGYGKDFGHGLGHGVGLEIHEEPRLSPTGSLKMENGMVVTVEPGIYVNGLGGVRIEDMIVIHDDTPVVLTSSTKNMIIL